MMKELLKQSLRIVIPKPAISISQTKKSYLVIIISENTTSKKMFNTDIYKAYFLIAALRFVLPFLSNLVAKAIPIIFKLSIVATNTRSNVDGPKFKLIL